MIPLPENFKECGWTFRQLARSPHYAVYLKVKGNAESYEVIEIQKIPAEEKFGKSYPNRERYPSSESWGSSGWSEMTLEKAMNRFDRLNKTLTKV